MQIARTRCTATDAYETRTQVNSDKPAIDTKKKGVYRRRDNGSWKWKEDDDLWGEDKREKKLNDGLRDWREKRKKNNEGRNRDRHWIKLNKDDIMKDGKREKRKKNNKGRNRDRHWIKLDKDDIMKDGKKRKEKKWR